MPQLAQLPASPGIHFSLVSQSHCVALSARDVNDFVVRESTDWPHMVLIQDAPVTQLSVDPSAPSEDNALVIDCRSMVIAQ
jgi:hypothetical protein